MLGYADWIVGGIAIAIGIVLCACAAISTEHLYELPKVRWLQQRYGRSATRSVLIVAGVALVALGIAIALGWKVEWNGRRTSLTPPTSDTCSA